MVGCYLDHLGVSRLLTCLVDCPTVYGFIFFLFLLEEKKIFAHHLYTQMQMHELRPINKGVGNRRRNQRMVQEHRSKGSGQ